MIRTWPIDESLEGERCDVALARLTGESRATCVTLLEEKRVTLNGKVAQKSARLAFGDVVEVDLPDPDMYDAEPTVELPIVFEDDSFVVIDKPAGVAAHPSQGWSGPTVTGSLTAMGTVLTSFGPSERKGIVHR
jgi:23S rRNA pseudouridine1911/1915/1917 synthase